MKGCKNSDNNWSYLQREDLSKSACAVCDVIGFETTVKLMKNLPQKGLYVHTAQNISKSKIVKIIGESNFLELSKFYHGEILFLPKSHALSWARARRIRQEIKNKNLNSKNRVKYYTQIAEKEGITLDMVRKIMRAK